MKITGNGTKTDRLMLSHRGTDLHFGCSIQHSQYQPFNDIERGNVSTIEFSDLYEVDQLIDMLNRFKEKSTYCCGYWKNK